MNNVNKDVKKDDRFISLKDAPISGMIVEAPKEWINKFNSGKWHPINVKDNLKMEDCYIEINFGEEGESYIDFSEDFKELVLCRCLGEHLLQKKKTKPLGSNPRIIERNIEIQKKYYELHYKKGYTATKAYEMLSVKYKRSPETIKTILKQTWD